MTKISTLITHKELKRRLIAEGIDPKAVSVLKPRWAETKPKEAGVHSALLTGDLIARSDGSIVCLDGMMGMDSAILADIHRGADGLTFARQRVLQTFPELGDSHGNMKFIIEQARAVVGWETYVKRMSYVPNGGVLAPS